MQKETIEKLKEKKWLLLIIGIIIIIVIMVGVRMSQNTKKQEDIRDETSTNPYVAKAKKADDIQIKDSDSKEVKIEKIQGKIELLNKEIDEKQEKIAIELEKVNKLYEEYIIVMSRN